MPPIAAPSPTHASSRSSTTRPAGSAGSAGRSSSNPTSASSSAIACGRDERQRHRVEHAAVLLDRAHALAQRGGQRRIDHVELLPAGVRTTIRDWSGRSGSTNRGTCSSIAASSRIVIHGNRSAGRRRARTPSDGRRRTRASRPRPAQRLGGHRLDRVAPQRDHPADLSRAHSRLDLSSARMSEIKDSILDTIGETPLVRLRRIGAGLKPQIVAKLECSIPAARSRTASRPAHRGRREDGRLSPAARSSSRPPATPAPASRSPRASRAIA